MHNDPLAESLEMGHESLGMGHFDHETDVQRSAVSLVDHLKEYARENPATVALCCFAVGFVVGWKLKPW